jgi:hypothetical protein
MDMKKDKKQKSGKKQEGMKTDRRKFLKGAVLAGGAAGAATLGFPMGRGNIGISDGLQGQDNRLEDARCLGREGHLQRLRRGLRQARQ